MVEREKAKRKASEIKQECKPNSMQQSTSGHAVLDNLKYSTAVSKAEQCFLMHQIRLKGVVLYLD
jgi:hypothetical protein